MFVISIRVAQNSYSNFYKQNAQNLCSNIRNSRLIILYHWCASAMYVHYRQNLVNLLRGKKTMFINMKIISCY